MMNVLSRSLKTLPPIGCLMPSDREAQRDLLWNTVHGRAGWGCSSVELNDINLLALKFYHHPRHLDPRA